MRAFAGLDIGFERDGFVTITGDGTQTRDWVHAEDVARAFEYALESNVRGVTLDVCTGVQTSMNSIAGMLDVPVKYIEARAGDAKELISDPGPARYELGFKAELWLEQRIMDAFPAIAASRKVTTL